MPSRFSYNVIDQGISANNTFSQRKGNVIEPCQNLVGSKIEYIGATSSFVPLSSTTASSIDAQLDCNSMERLADSNDLGKTIIDFNKQTRRKPEKCSFAIKLQNTSSGRSLSCDSIIIDVMTEGKFPHNPVSTKAENIVSCLNYARDLRFIILVVRDPPSAQTKKGAISTTAHLLKFGNHTKAKNFLVWFSDELVSFAVDKGKLDDFAGAEDFLDSFLAKDVNKMSASRKCNMRRTKRPSLSELNGLIRKDHGSMKEISTHKHAITKRRSRRRSSSVDLLIDLIDRCDTNTINKNVSLMN